MQSLSNKKFTLSDISVGSASGEDEADLKNYNFLGIDPGRKRPMAACTIQGEKIPTDWNNKERKQVVDSAMDN